MQKILPDTSFLAQWRDKIEAVVITHGQALAGGWVLVCAGLRCTADDRNTRALGVHLCTDFTVQPWGASDCSMCCR